MDSSHRPDLRRRENWSLVAGHEHIFVPMLQLVTNFRNSSKSRDAATGRLVPAQLRKRIFARACVAGTELALFAIISPNDTGRARNETRRPPGRNPPCQTTGN